MDLLFGGFKRSKLMPNVEAALHRLRIKITSEKAAAAKERKEIAELLRGGREELAKIKAEALFCSDNRTEALSILELYLELLRNRVDLICAEKDCPADLEVTIATIVYSASRVQINELTEIKKQFQYKYGKDMEKICSKPHERMVKCLSLAPPSAAICIRYLEEISISHQVDYTPSDPGFSALSLPVTAPAGSDLPRAPASGLGRALNGALPAVPSVFPAPVPAPSASAPVPAPAPALVPAPVSVPVPVPTVPVPTVLVPGPASFPTPTQSEAPPPYEQISSIFVAPSVPVVVATAYPIDMGTGHVVGITTNIESSTKVGTVSPDSPNVNGAGVVEAEAEKAELDDFEARLAALRK